MSGSVLSVSTRALLAACSRLGLDTDQMLASAGVDRATVEDPDSRIPFLQVQALWRKAYELSEDQDLALHAVEILPFGAYRVIDFLAWNAPTVGDALAHISEYFPLINSVMTLPISIGDREVTLAVVAASNPERLTRQYAEYTLAAVFLRTRFNTAEPYRLTRVEFSHARPANISEHERIFACPVTFGADVCQMVVARDVWDAPRTGADTAMFSVLDTHAKTLLDRLEDDGGIVGRVREAIGAELRGGDPRLASIARRLAMTPRTLQRRLSDRGAVFNDLLDTMRFGTAKSYLSQGDVAGTEIAYLLGFAEQSSFNRAFRRWSGHTPMEFRRTNAGA